MAILFDSASLHVQPWDEARVISPVGHIALQMFDGQLRAVHGKALESASQTLLLCAQRNPDGPTEWERHLALAALNGTPLIPSTAHGYEEHWLQNLTDLKTVADRALSLARDEGASRRHVEAVGDVVHELGANALLDAPVGPDGMPKYAYRRDDVQSVDAEDVCRVTLGVGARHLFISAWDRFGRLTRAPWVRALEGMGGPQRVDRTGGGAGLGLRRLLDAANAIAVRIKPGQATEVLCSVELTPAGSVAENLKSFFFVEDKV